MHTTHVFCWVAELVVASPDDMARRGCACSTELPTTNCHLYLITCAVFFELFLVFRGGISEDAEILMDIHVVQGGIKHASRNVGTVVRNAFQMGENI